jgi:hypothetical protein
MSLYTIGLIMNLALCIFIAAFGIWGYIRIKRVGLIYLGISFLFYAL